MNHHQRLPIEIAQTAAKLMHEGGYQYYLEAKHKAASQMGEHDNRSLWNNAEIEAALIAHQSLFHTEKQNNIPTNLYEHRIQLRLNKAFYYNAYKFVACDFPIIVIVLSKKLIKTLPIDGIDECQQC